ncbi:MAG: MFS transporter [Candidatus Heimdallarchaeota archaeon]|nr:MFS transporter [Candidatus Heimdallarchaeota archaeon]MCK4770604.1 MFS transporter [Candidatus Heimdallarchaeota archaeon]
MNEQTENKIIQRKILKDPLMWKFKFYGFFKNLRFFEPYLIVMLYVYLSEFNTEFILFKIGLIFLVQEVFTYVFEIPSGILADRFGKKNELLLCFIFYIISFVLFFIGLGRNINYFFVIFIAAAFYGLGESFRSGTHKAMILTWMDRNEFQNFKTFVYGRTRSWSLIGSTVNGVISIFMVLFISASQWVFIITIIPYLLDFILISTYPSYMNEHAKIETNFLKEMGKGFKEILVAFKNKRLIRGIFSSSSYDAVFKSIKDYVQPVIIVYIGAIIINLGLDSTSLVEEDLITIILGVMYSIFYVFSSLASRNAYKVKELSKGAKKAMDVLFYLFAGVLILNSVFIWIDIPAVVIFLFLFIYVFENFRRPLAVDYLAEVIKKEQRATMLSVEAQFKSILVFIFAPLFGLIADFSIPGLFVGIAALMVLVNIFLLSGDTSEIKNEEKENNH